MDGEITFPITSRGFGFMETGEAFEIATRRLVGTVQCMSPESRNVVEREAWAAWKAWLAWEPARRRRAA